jgi:hypothetical protein
MKIIITSDFRERRKKGFQENFISDILISISSTISEAISRLKFGHNSERTWVFGGEYGVGS